MNQLLEEQHPLEPFLPENAQVLMLGSFPPPPDRWSMDFYYPNFQNDMWRIMGLVFFDDKDYFVDITQKTFKQKELEKFLRNKGIALSDTATAIIRQRGNASDKFLEITTERDVKGLIKSLPFCKAIVTTGQKATDTLVTVLNIEKPEVGRFTEYKEEQKIIKVYRMPSSSRAYPKPLVEKAEVYKKMFKELGVI